MKKKLLKNISIDIKQILIKIRISRAQLVAKPRVRFPLLPRVENIYEFVTTDYNDYTFSSAFVIKCVVIESLYKKTCFEKKTRKKMF